MATRKNFPARKEQRRVEAQARQEVEGKRTTTERLANLDEHSLTASKERAKLDKRKD